MVEKLARITELDSLVLESINDEEQTAVETEDQDAKALTIEEAIANLEVYLKGDQPTVEAHDGRGVQSYAKLPKLEIKHFSGNALDFPSFEQQFEASVGRSDLADIAKFSYLKGLLNGEALRCIQGLALSNDNYEAAWDLLRNRYGRKNLVVSSLMKQMTALKLCGDNDTKSLRALLDKVSSSIRALTALGVPLDTYGALLAPLIRQKLPQKLNLMLSRKLADSAHGDDYIDINAITAFLESELTARESVELTSISSSAASQGSSSNSGGSSGGFADNGRGNGHSKSKHKGKSRVKYEKATGQALVGSRAPTCSFCQGDIILINARRLRD